MAPPQFETVWTSRRKLFNEMLERDGNDPAIAESIALALDYTTLAVFSFVELQQAILTSRQKWDTRVLRSANANLSQAARFVRRAHRTRSQPLKAFYANLATVCLNINNVQRTLEQPLEKMYVRLSQALLSVARRAYIHTFHGTELERLSERFSEALQDQAIATLDAMFEATSIPLFARVIRIFRIRRPLLLKNIDEVNQWHRNMREYLEASLKYAILLDGFIESISASPFQTTRRHAAGDLLRSDKIAQRVNERLARLRATYTR